MYQLIQNEQVYSSIKNKKQEQREYDKLGETNKD